MDVDTIISWISLQKIMTLFPITIPLATAPSVVPLEKSRNHNLI